jgi:flagellar motor switch protein FliN/FliY
MAEETGAPGGSPTPVQTVETPAAAAPAAASPPSDAAGAAKAAVDAGPGAAPTGPPAAEMPLDSSGIDELLRQASFDDAKTVAEAAPPAGDAFNLPNFQQVIQDAQMSSVDLLRDVELTVKIELGRSRMLVEDVLKLAEGSVVELDKLAGDPVDVFANERLVARGEVLVLNDNFCVRVNEIVATAKDEGT